MLHFAKQKHYVNVISLHYVIIYITLMQLHYANLLCYTPQM